MTLVLRIAWSQSVFGCHKGNASGTCYGFKDLKRQTGFLTDTLAVKVGKKSYWHSAFPLMMLAYCDQLCQKSCLSVCLCATFILADISAGGGNVERQYMRWNDVKLVHLWCFFWLVQTTCRHLVHFPDSKTISSFTFHLLFSESFKCITLDRE